MKKCAIIDDYQECALEMADWASLGDKVSVTAFKDHIADEDEFAAAMRDLRTSAIATGGVP